MIDACCVYGERRWVYMSLARKFAGKGHLGNLGLDEKIII